MARSLLLLLLLIFTATATANTKSSNNNSIRRLFQEQQTNLHFYWQLKLEEPNRTVLEINKSPINSPTDFGRTKVFDVPITVGPSITSQQLGWSRGTYVYADQNDYALVMAATYKFVDDKYGGSTFSILGHNEFKSNQVRELPVVGGTGVFRLARGYCHLLTYSEDAATQSVIVDYNCTIFHVPEIISSI